MTEGLIDLLYSDDGFYIYISIFSLLILGGFGFPIPEDLPLFLGGVAAAQKLINLPILFIVSYLGVVLGDQIIYWFGYIFGEKLLRAGAKSSLLPSLTEERLLLVQQKWRNRRLMYFLLARHLFPLRSVTFLSAGALRVPYLEFLITDAIAAFISVIFMLGIGLYIGHYLTRDVVEHIISESHFYILISTVIICAALGLKYWFQAKRDKTKNSSEMTSVQD